jgi:enoyl-[acyl-carrier protein] reductase I
MTGPMTVLTVMLLPPRLALAERADTIADPDTATPPDSDGMATPPDSDDPTIRLPSMNLPAYGMLWAGGPMGLLAGRKALVFGVANDHSIAWGIARALHAEGAEIGFSSVESLIERRVRPLATSIGSTFVEPCDVQDDEQIARVIARWDETHGQLDILVHALAFARREDLDGRFVDTSREGFALALDVSAYSLVALAHSAAPIMPTGASIITLTYHGAQKVVANYNVMGVAKAALEASVRYLAVDLGPDGIRVNAISAGPVRTLAASGVAGFKSMYGRFRDVAPLRRNIDLDDVGGAAVFLASDMSRGVTGDILYVDAGFNVLAVPAEEA